MSSQSIKINSGLKALLPNKITLVIILTMMSVSGLIGSDIYLPALPIIKNYFQISSHYTQFTISIYLLGLAIGQIILGSMSEIYGRKRLVLIGMCLFAISSIGCIITDNFFILLGFRLLQALGSSSGLVLGRAIIGDIFDGKESAKIFATIFPFVGMSPAIAPLIGGFITKLLGWKFCFIFLAIFAFLIIVLVYFYIPETITKNNQEKASLHPKNILNNYLKILFRLDFLAYAGAPCFAYLAYFAYITQSPFIFNQAGYHVDQIGFFYITLSITYVIGNLLSRYLVHTYALNKVLKIGYMIFTGGGALIAVAGYTTFPITFMLVAISILTMGNGFLIPMGSAGVINTFSHNRGYASGLLGFFQLVVASISASIIGPISNNHISSMGAFILITTLLGSCSFFLLAKK